MLASSITENTIFMEIPLRTILFLILPFFFIACQQQPHQMTPQEKDAAKKEIAGIVDGIVRSCDQLDYQGALKPYYDSPSFVAVNTDGSVVDYEGFKSLNTELFKAASSFKFNTTKVDVHFLADNVVLCTWTGNSEIGLKSGEHFRTPAFAATLLFSKVNSEWKITYSHESASLPTKETPVK